MALVRSGREVGEKWEEGTGKDRRTRQSVDTKLRAFLLFYSGGARALVSTRYYWDCHWFGRNWYRIV